MNKEFSFESETKEKLKRLGFWPMEIPRRKNIIISLMWFLWECGETYNKIS